MRRFSLFAVFMPLILLGCSQPLPKESFRPPVPAASGDIVIHLDAPNEKTPTTIDSLEPENLKTPIAITTITGGVLIGDVTAPFLTIYTDYDCDYCRQFSLRDLPVVERASIQKKTLAIRLQFLPRTDAGTFMAKIAMCSARLGAFTSAELLLSAKPTAPVQSLTALAKEIGIDQKKLTECMADNVINQELQKTREDATAAGISRVPTCIIKDTRWLGLKQQDELLRTIDEALRP